MGDMKIEIVDRDDPANVILSIIKKRGVISYRELVSVATEKSISIQKLKRILISLIRSGHVIELRCRLFAAPEYLAKAGDEELSRVIKEAIVASGIRRCGKALFLPSDEVNITVFTGDGKVAVSVIRKHSTSSQRSLSP